MLKILRTAVALGLACVPVLGQAHELRPIVSAYHAHHTVAVTTGALNLRTGPGTSHRVIVSMPRNARVTVHHCRPGGGWCHVTYGGLDGWASGRYLHAVRSPDAPEIVIIPRGYELKAIVGTGRHVGSTVIILPE